MTAPRQRHEFELIQHYFATQEHPHPAVMKGIGDDAAIVTLPVGHELVVTTDTLVNGVHFPEHTAAVDIGHKSLAVNLSDLAAMGATPAFVTLALTLPTAEDHWIQDFCHGFFSLAKRYGTSLIGGDLTHGPLSITVQAMGFIPAGKAILRCGAKPGDRIYVSGTLGDAGLALQSLTPSPSIPEADRATLLKRLNQPEPRVTLGNQLIGIASAAIDISDGFAADLTHILEASHVGARIDRDRLPLSTALLRATTREKAIALALGAGDDYELCFTVPAVNESLLKHVLIDTPITCVGEIIAQSGLECIDESGECHDISQRGFQHF